jgi:hypothetical protein
LLRGKVREGALHRLHQQGAGVVRHNEDVDRQLLDLSSAWRLCRRRC